MNASPAHLSAISFFTLLLHLFVINRLEETIGCYFKKSRLCLTDEKSHPSIAYFYIVPETNYIKYTADSTWLHVT